MAAGKLYDVDMRLRPSGRSGPVATSIAAFQDYQESKAWTWEHLALTRAHCVAGSKAVGDKVEAIRKQIICRDRDPTKVATDVIEMRERIAKSKPGRSAVWGIKARPGGLLDVELIAQTFGLLCKSAACKPARQLVDAAASGLLPQADADVLAGAHVFYKSFQSGLRLLLEEGKTPEDLGPGGRDFLLKSTDVETLADLKDKIQNTAQDCAGRIERLLAGLAGTSAKTDGT